MAKHKCLICGYIYDNEKEKIKFDKLSDNYICSMCGVPKSMFEKLEDNIEIVEEDIKDDLKTVKNAITISEDNVAIERIVDKCIECEICINTCKTREGIDDICNGKACVNCGQCIQTCPTGALIQKQDKNKLDKALENKICIAYTSPSVRGAIGEEFGFDEGTFLQGKLVSALRKLGFDYVLDVTFGADLTIVEEANELVSRIQNNGILPMFTSCCPSWIKYAEQYYPEILPNISTCKSPIGMQGQIVKNYFIMKNNLNKEHIYTVAITPCTAKKFEISREEIDGTDCVITTKELIDIIKEKGIDFKNLEDEEYDSLLSEGTGAGMIFGNTGGVMEAALRTAYNIITGKELDKGSIEFTNVRGIENLKEATIDIEGIRLNVAIVNQISLAKEILESVKNGTSKYHYIEIMNCLGGCIGGGGQPKVPAHKEIAIKEKRIKSLYERDKIRKIRTSHNNPEIKKLYEEYLEKPLSDKADKLLHTKYKKREF